MGVSAAFRRDANRVPIIQHGVQSVKSQTLSGNNTTVNTALFRVTGVIEVQALYAIVTTVLGANNTAAYYRFNDQGAQQNITLNTGTTLTAAPVGSILAKTSTAGTAVTLTKSDAGRVQETSANHDEFQSFNLIAKNGANSDVEFVYSTTDTPTSGVLQHFLCWVPLSADADVTVQ